MIQYSIQSNSVRAWQGEPARYCATQYRLINCHSPRQQVFSVACTFTGTGMRNNCHLCCRVIASSMSTDFAAEKKAVGPITRSEYSRQSERWPNAVSRSV